MIMLMAGHGLRPPTGQMEDDLQAIKLRQRVAIDVSHRDTKMEMLGKKYNAGSTGTNRIDGHAVS